MQLLSTSHTRWEELTKSELEDAQFHVQENPHIKEKKSIERCLLTDNVDGLRQNAINNPSGLLVSSLRATAWPLLLNVQHELSQDASSLKPHLEEGQVRLDVDRSYLPSDKHHLLQNVIVKLLRNHPYLHYYQGFHDVVSVLLVTLDYDETLTYDIAETLCLHHLRDFMLADMTGTTDLLPLVVDLVKVADKRFGDLLELIPPFYSLASIITMFSHDLDVQDVVVLWDFAFAMGNVTQALIYLYAVLILINKQQIIDQVVEMSGCQIDTSVTSAPTLSRQFVLENTDAFHFTLSNLTKCFGTNGSSNQDLLTRWKNETQYLISVVKLSDLPTSKDIFSGSAIKQPSSSNIDYTVRLHTKYLVARKRNLSVVKNCKKLLHRNSNNLKLLLKVSVTVGILSLVLGRCLEHNQYVGLPFHHRTWRDMCNTIWRF
ncbi:GTPase-activating protein for yeast Rab family members [Komagataella phaffii CBS 7435]|uniref:Rab GTPase-activating protein n=2 Tax=Komagataella phaffii TaxID=460519 RepID=C4QY84_KOMPG|nr:Rab GTPase-activating protein [Komagataella phaffii GS115]AOA61376.1 GQ67_01804T0 [Komagataella phaffii]CAH2447029.1 GTPase-activating protein for yeast Rab family members [Komagataella phaffii CBS 7435]AOA66097.1 GQ68_01819T0 [Komagataella phaffii GS115]CAY68207.1 Rab GTPase-activating protein [Komagataella phaffii GS115]CCA37280.1 GTPase-activating protein for yeast Rab family members [Komagataella phaffii CBS 7435]